MVAWNFRALPSYRELGYPVVFDTHGDTLGDKEINLADNVSLLPYHLSSSNNWHGCYL